MIENNKSGAEVDARASGTPFVTDVVDDIPDRRAASDEWFSDEAWIMQVAEPWEQHTRALYAAGERQSRPLEP